MLIAALAASSWDGAAVSDILSLYLSLLVGYSLSFFFFFVNRIVVVAPRLLTVLTIHLLLLKSLINVLDATQTLWI